MKKVQNDISDYWLSKAFEIFAGRGKNSANIYTADK